MSVNFETEDFEITESLDSSVTKDVSEPVSYTHLTLPTNREV